MLLLAFGAACKRQDMTHHEYMYVSAPETSLRDRVATMYNRMGTVHNGDRVEVLENQRRFVRVRTDSGQEGWVEERSLVPQDIYDGFQKLAQDNASTPVQARGTTRAEVNMHLTPARDADHLYQLKDGEKVEVLKRATADKNVVKPQAGAAGNSGEEQQVQGQHSLEKRNGGDQTRRASCSGNPKFSIGPTSLTCG